MSVAIVPSSSALGDSGTTGALATMRSFFQCRLDHDNSSVGRGEEELFHSSGVELHVPLPRESRYDAFSCDFGLSIDALEAGLRFLLHHVIEACLEQWRISPSQMAPNSWRFPTEWTSRTVSSFISMLSADETKLVEILRGILSVSREVMNMNEAWLAEAGLSPALGGMSFLFLGWVWIFPNRTFCRAEMFKLGKMKSAGGAGSGSTAPSVASVPVAGDAGVSMVEKRPSSCAEVGLRKHLRKVTTE
ncbi:hypothetical protein BHE74_00015348 [Ensete ventricosum]|nr:hypothetical protein BHE74_00015348 [Ensete ventricosum]